jgi:hypothetical protein
VKKLLLVVFVIVICASVALATSSTPTASTAQTSTGAAGSVTPTVDVLGAHNNYGRGCAGCHAPHSGAAGAGGNAITGGATDAYTGANALFAQDMGPLYSASFDFSDLKNTGSANSYIFVAPAGLVGASAQGYSDIRGIVMCLACHDGAVSKGAMMQNKAYEQQIGALPSSYGSGAIPTLLGADGSSSAYHNDHPIGENATVAAALGGAYGTGSATNGLNYTITGTSPNQAITGITAIGTYTTFMTNYGAPALMKGAHSYGTPINAAGVPYLVCTTCHNQHSMNIYASSANSPITGNAAGTYATYFFINGPYNVNNTNLNASSAASTTQFCRQCHFGESNESVGGSIPTAF